MTSARIENVSRRVVLKGVTSLGGLVIAVKLLPVEDAFAHPLKALGVSLRGPHVSGPMAPEIPLEGQRAAEYNFSRHVEHELARIRESKARADQTAAAR